MILSSQVPDPGTPIFDKGGYIDPVWHNFFSTLLRRTGGSVGIDASDAPALQGALPGTDLVLPFEPSPLHSVESASRSVSDAAPEVPAPTHGQQNDPILHDIVTITANGFMSAADKIKLDAMTVPVAPPTALIADVVTQNTTADGAVLTFTMPASSIVVGTTIAVRLYGLITSAALAGTLSVWIKAGATKIMTQTFTLPGLGQVNTGLFYTASLTARTVGASGAIQIASLMTSNGNALNGGPAVGSVSAALNTTVAQTFTIGWNWSVASAANIATAKNATFVLEKQQ